MPVEIEGAVQAALAVHTGGHVRWRDEELGAADAESPVRTHGRQSAEQLVRERVVH